jgi:outer membrane protein OmpA-like peptidoglycan-associated protein
MQQYFSLAIASLCASVAIGIAFAETDAGPKYVVYFPHRSSEIISDAEVVAQEAVAYVQARGIKRVVLTGYWDSSEAKQATLAHARAKAVADKMRSLGVSSNVLFILQASRDLVVPTTSGASEPINQQVAITF